MSLLPDLLLQSLKDVEGFNETDFVAIHESGEQITSIRINPAKVFNAVDHFNDTEKVPWSTNGYYLNERPSFTVDPLFHAGAYYVQEASSMFLEEVVKQTCDLLKPLRVLDLCAAPGGKSTLLQSIISAESLLVSNEVIKARVNILTENVTKWGAANVVVTNNNAKDFQRLINFFDVIVIYAPCSGSGLFRKDPNAINEWSENSVVMCSLRQQRILADILPALKPDGILIYSTCSYSESENEAIADKLVDELNMENIPINISSFNGIVETCSSKNNCKGYRFYPDKIKGEGFYIAAFKKNAEPDESEKRTKYKDLRVAKSAQEIINSYVLENKKYIFITQKEDILAIPTSILNSFYEVQFDMYIKMAGIKIGTLIRNELIPAHDFALSKIVSDKIKIINVSLEQAQNYLRRKEIVIENDIKGWALLNYNEVHIGFVKVLPGRINNYYPKELRILNK